MKKHIYFFSFLMLTLACALMGAQGVNASSVYDNIVDNASSPYTVSNSSYTNFFNTPYDIGVYLGSLSESNISNLASGFCSTNANKIFNAIQNIGANKPYFIQQWISGSTSYIYVYVDKSETPSITWDWYSSGYLYMTSSTSSIDFFSMRVNLSGNTALCDGSTSNSVNLHSPAKDTFNIETNQTVNYPVDYEGEEIPIVTPSKTPIEYWVNFSFTNTTTMITSKYLNKTTDPISNAPDPEYVWWELRIDDGDPETINDVACETELKPNIDFNSDINCQYDPNFKIDKTLNYYLVARINPLNNEHFENTPYEYTFKDTVYKIDFTKSSIGSTVSCEGGAIEDYQSVYCVSPKEFNVIDCFTPEFPFVDLQSCTETFSILTNYLAFGGISFPEWSYPSQCRNLSVADDWLGLENGYTVCPQFPQFVRDVTTPFVTFLLGLLTLSFIHRRSGDLNG